MEIQSRRSCREHVPYLPWKTLYTALFASLPRIGWNERTFPCNQFLSSRSLLAGSTHPDSYLRSFCHAKHRYFLSCRRSRGLRSQTANSSNLKINSHLFHKSGSCCEKWKVDASATCQQPVQPSNLEGDAYPGQLKRTSVNTATIVCFKC